MNHLIVPTDFSPAAKNAMNYAIHLANQFDSQITLIHCLDFDATVDLWGIQLKLKAEAERELNAMRKASLEPLLSAVSMDVKVLKGTLLEELKRLSDRQAADLIIMGTEGAGDFEALFLETNTVSIVNTVNIPILVIPEKYTYQPIKEVAFFVDNFEIKEKVLAPFREIAMKTRAHISIHHFIQLFEVAGVDSGLPDYLHGLDYSIHQTRDWEDINSAIDQLIIKTKADLVCMIKRDRGWLENLLHLSKTASMAYHPRVPLLVLHQN